MFFAPIYVNGIIQKNILDYINEVFFLFNENVMEILMYYLSQTNKRARKRRTGRFSTKVLYYLLLLLAF